MNKAPPPTVLQWIDRSVGRVSAIIIAFTASAMVAFLGVLVPGALVFMGVFGSLSSIGLIMPAMPILAGLLLLLTIGVGMYGLAAATVRDGLHRCVPILGPASIAAIACLGLARTRLPDMVYWIIPLVLASYLIVCAYRGAKRGLAERLGTPQRGVGRTCAQCGYDVASLGEHVPCPECGGVMRIQGTAFSEAITPAALPDEPPLGSRASQGGHDR